MASPLLPRAEDRKPSSSETRGESVTKVLVVDIGGTNIKIRVPARRTVIKIPSGPGLTPRRMVQLVRNAVDTGDYSVVSIGYPGPVVRGKPVRDPMHLARGWVRFDFQKAFGCPVRIINDAAMQALGSYQGGHMLFLGLGTGLGSALITDGVVAPLELAHLPYKRGRTYEDYVGKAALERYGKKKWRHYVADVAQRLGAALVADYVVLGGGNAKLLRALPPGTILGSNTHAFVGGVRLWTMPRAKGPSLRVR